MRDTWRSQKMKTNYRLISLIAGLLFIISWAILLNKRATRKYYYVTAVVWLDSKNEKDTLKVVSKYQDPFFITEKSCLYLRAENSWVDGNKLLMTGVNLYRIISVEELSDESFKTLYKEI